MNLRKLPISLFISATLMALPWSGSMAEDEILLKNGQKITGEILSENASSVEIQISVTKTIKERKTFKRDEIQSVKKESLDAKEWKQISAQLPVPEFSDKAVYDDLIENQIKPFLKKHEGSLLLSEVKKELQSLEKDRERIEKGDIKIAGEWITSEKLDENPMKYRGQILFMRMQKAAEDSKHFDVLRLFDELRFNYGASSTLPKAYELAKSSLEKFDRQIKQQIEHQPTLQKAREDGLKNIFSPSERTRTELAISNEKKLITDARELEKENGVEWLSYDPYDLQQLTDTQKRVEVVQGEIDGFSVSAFNRYGKIISDAYQALRDNKPELVQELLNSAKAENAPQAIIDDLGKKASELSRKIEEEKNRPIPTPSEDPDSIEELSPVHKAMSNLNKEKEEAQAKEKEKEAQKEETPTESAPQETPAEETKTPDEVVDPATAPSATPESSPQETQNTEAQPQRQATPQGMPLWNKMLIGVAGILILSVLIAKLTGKGGKKEES